MLILEGRRLRNVATAGPDSVQITQHVSAVNAAVFLCAICAATQFRGRLHYKYVTQTRLAIDPSHLKFSAASEIVSAIAWPIAAVSGGRLYVIGRLKPGLQRTNHCPPRTPR